MKRLFLGLTLLLMAFLASFDALDGMHRLLARVGIQRWMTELVLAAAAVAAFVYATSTSFASAAMLDSCAQPIMPRTARTSPAID